MRTLGSILRCSRLARLYDPGSSAAKCSSGLEDNQWMLDVSRDSAIMVGAVGHLTPGTPEAIDHLAVHFTAAELGARASYDARMKRDWRTPQ
jgi:hypothetical protein